MVLIAESHAHNITRELVRNANLRPTPDLLLQKLGVQYPGICVLKHTSGNSDVH